MPNPRHPPLGRLRAGLLALLVPALASPAAAQVTLDLRALDQGGARPAAPKTPPQHRPAQPQAARKRAEKAKGEARKTEPAQPGAASAPASAAASPAAGPRPPPAGLTLPSAPPPTVSLAPIVVEPPAGTPEVAPPPPISATAGGGVEMQDGGLRVLFAPDRTELSPRTEAGIKAYADQLPKTDATSFNVVAFAAGTPEDPSSARRLSLSRALAVRSVLMEGGVASARIYVRALGTQHASGPADRVDVTALGTNAAAEAPR